MIEHFSDTDALDNWWALTDPDDITAKLFDTVEEIEEEQVTTRQGWNRYAQLYSNRNELGLNWGLESPTDSFESLVTENIVKSTIDTAASIIAKNRVRPRIMTNGGDWSTQRKAIKLESWLYGEMQAREVWELGPEIFRDAVIFGTGCVKVVPNTKKKRVELERCLIDEIVIDEASAVRGKPREIFHRRLVDKYVLAAKFPKHRDAIMQSGTRKHYAEREIPKDMVLVVEGHRLPDGSGKNGRHVVAVEHAILTEEAWEHEWFPYVFLRWDGRPISGFYGLGGARQLMGYQKRINQLNNFIEKCQNLIAVPRVFVDVASKLLKIQLNNEIGAVIPYRGKPPTFFTPQALNAEIYQYKEQLKRAALNDFGISQLSAQSLKPAGLESAAALREFSDIETSRFSIHAQRYEHFFTQLAKAMISVARAFVFNAKDVVSFKERNKMVQVPWSKVDMEEDRFVVDIQPASVLSMSPSARLQAVTELAQVGQLDKAEIRRLLGHPDLVSSDNIATADMDEIFRIEEVLLEGDFEPPEPHHNLPVMLRRMPLLAQYAKNNGAPESIVENVRSWISQAQALLEMAQPAPAPGAAVDPMTGQPAPIDPAMAAGAPPVASGVAGSEVIQNLPGPVTG